MQPVVGVVVVQVVGEVAADKAAAARDQDNLRDIADDPRYSFVQGDITDAALVGELMEEADCVVNFAGRRRRPVAADPATRSW